MKEKSKPQKQIPKKKVFLELLHQRLGHRSKISLLAGDTEMFWQDIDIRVNNDQFSTTCKISTINKKVRSKIPLKPKTHFRWVFIDIILSTYPKRSTKNTTFYNYLLIVDAY